MAQETVSPPKRSNAYNIFILVLAVLSTDRALAVDYTKK